MFKLFKRREDGENRVMIQGMVYGLGGALILAIIIFGVVFGGKIFNKDNADTQLTSNLRITVITKKDCTDCFDINLLIDAIEQNDAKIKQETLDLGDKNAQKLIEKYKITKVPTVIVSGDLDKNPNLQSLWTSLGEVTDGVFVFRQVIPPYIDVASGQLKGKISLVELTDNSCTNCYDVVLHETALKNLGIDPKDKKVVDVGSDEGKQLVAKYKIEKVPTILISGEVAEYPNLVQLWPNYGKTTDDGTYIFTNLEVMGTYKDLTKNKVIEVKPQEQTAAPVTPAQ